MNKGCRDEKEGSEDVTSFTNDLARLSPPVRIHLAWKLALGNSEARVTRCSEGRRRRRKEKQVVWLPLWGNFLRRVANPARRFSPRGWEEKRYCLSNSTRTASHRVHHDGIGENMQTFLLALDLVHAFGILHTPHHFYDRWIAGLEKFFAQRDHLRLIA